MDRPPSAPPVVVVVVADEPGPELQKALASFGRQDYPNLSVLVLDSGHRSDLAHRVAAVLPEAYVKRVDGQSGFGAVANDALETVQGAAFLLFCHSDVAPEPDAVRRMVEEALRSNAAVVAPKVVEWDRPERLLDVGLVVDKTGSTAPIADTAELDQEQHDAVRDVFAVTSTCMLVRSDLFSALGGFDAAMGDYGADVDFCWRAQVAGGRVLVVPAARVRHRPRAAEGPEARARRFRYDRRNHLRALLKSYSFLHLLRVLPQAALLTAAEVIIALVSRRGTEARDLASAWWWNLRHLGGLRVQRRLVQRARAVPDSDVRRLQVRGSVRMTTYLQRRLHAEDRAEAIVQAGQRLAGTVGRGPGQVAALVLGVLLLAILFGSRHLIGGRVPAVGEFLPFPRVPTLLAHYGGGWRTTGLGSSAPAPTAFAMLALGGIIFVGKMALLHKVLLLAAWPLAAMGVWRITRPFGSTLSRLVAVIAYLAVPLPYDALARGRWSGLVAWAVLPWLLTIVLRLSALPPFGAEDPDAHVPATQARTEILKLGLLLGVVGAFVPSVAVVLIVAVVGLFVGSLLAGGAGGAARALGGAAVATVIGVVLNLPWTVDLLRPSGWVSVSGVAPDAARAAGFGALLRFELGPLGAAPLGWAFVVAAALPLAIGRSWRFSWAVRLWTAALVSAVAAWTGERGWLPLRFETPDALLAPTALGLALAAALGAAAFDIDLPGYRFGWRQLASLAAGGALVAGVLPVLGGVADGRWEMTDEEVSRSLGWMAPEARSGAFRVLWLGDPQALPIDGWHLGDGLAYGTSRNGPPDATDLLPGSDSSATQALARSLQLAERGDTARLGRLLAPMAVRYIVVPVELSTGEERPGRFPVRSTLTRALVSQIDLRLLPSDPGVAVYENTSWGPGRAVLPDRLSGPVPRALGAGADLSGGTPVLLDGGPIRFRGSIPDGTVLVSEAATSRWALTVEGDGAAHQPAFGVANAYGPGAGGRAVLRYRTPLWRYGAVLLQLALWAAAVRALLVLRRRAVQLEALAYR